MEEWVLEVIGPMFLEEMEAETRAAAVAVECIITEVIEVAMVVQA